MIVLAQDSLQGKLSSGFVAWCTDLQIPIQYQNQDFHTCSVVRKVIHIEMGQATKFESLTCTLLELSHGGQFSLSAWLSAKVCTRGPRREASGRFPHERSFFYCILIVFPSFLLTRERLLATLLVATDNFIRFDMPWFIYLFS